MTSSRSMCNLILFGFTLFVLLVGCERGRPPEIKNALIIETEWFEDYGGWVHDSQFMDQMGSPFLLAHGLGVPVVDAKTKVIFPASGTYHVWVRTRDWVATWEAPGTPGRFQILIDGAPLNTTFGTEGAEWHWQSGGLVKINSDQVNKGVTIALHDLTGFEGRCDAILFVPSEKSDLQSIFIPPDSGLALARLREQMNPQIGEIQDAGKFDLVVVGGGISGTAAAIAAARNGLSVALIQDRPVLGGNNSSEIRVWLQGVRNRVPYHRIGDIVMELEQQEHKHNGPENTAEIYEDAKKIGVVENEKNISLRLSHRVNGVEMEGNRITSVIAEHTRKGVKYRFRGRFFSDCTGDGNLGALAGADFEMAEEHMGRCNLWNVADMGIPQSFPRCPWALDLRTKPFPGRGKGAVDAAFERMNSDQDGEAVVFCELCDPFPLKLGEWTWESGFNHDPIEKSEYIRDWNFRAAYGAVDALKNVDGVLPNHKLNWIAHISGKRESRRLLGDIILTMDDIMSGRKFEDGCVPTCWPLDVHFPDPKYNKSFEGDAFIASSHYPIYAGSAGGSYWVPYRCLYSRNIENMFMAGRDISVTHQALGATRVMRTGGCMGEVVGLAASICVAQETTPRGVWQDHLNLLKEKMADPGYSRYPERPLPIAMRDKIGENIVLTANISASSQAMISYSPVFVQDQRGSGGGNGMRWVSVKEKQPWLQFDWDQPVSVTAMRVTSGVMLGNLHPFDKDYRIAGEHVSMIEDYHLEVDVNGNWKSIDGAKVTGNTQAECSTLFDPVQGQSFRLLITKTPDRQARIWEVELYELPKDVSIN